MKDPFTTAYSELVQNQIEFASTIEGILAEARAGNAPTGQVSQVREMLDTFNTLVDSMAIRLVSQYDETASMS
ncbi:hypothetical protein [Pseudomonas syringae]|uniref:hypothetical protein n=1 Tax=Pseudomonas syringae TaxID=317 RepID=UPI003F7519EB